MHFKVILWRIGNLKEKTKWFLPTGNWLDYNRGLPKVTQY